ncbi:hypothetical protein BCR43DRAFT_499279 [Syncephalastrum racemosum]|uniref:Uncharacterized protein n=1 Tax=Syncephalastrum racemosum TaxID=13706 RepID=A0A1X2H018_SYNRA|nr:hypothetical protein BCR43DRAFT_499279 [Syncephalastrum racemosum]
MRSTVITLFLVTLISHALSAPTFPIAGENRQVLSKVDNNAGAKSKRDNAPDFCDTIQHLPVIGNMLCSQAPEGSQSPPP